jgi:hypothetical protein
MAPQEFHEKFEAQMKGSPFSAFVSHYSPEELAKMNTVTNANGTAGLAVKDHGDGRIEATALFSTEKGAGIALLHDAIANHGVNYVECYAGQLDKMYEKLGFEEASRDAFNREYASPDWNYDRFGTPDYVTMRLKK